MTYLLNYPHHILFGWGCRQQLPTLLPPGTAVGSPYLLVLGNSQHRAGLQQQFATLLGPPVALHTGIPPEPELQHVDQLLDLLRHHRPAFLVACGGGSLIDVAKAAAILAPLAGHTADYFHGRLPLTGPGLPLLALPTTAGTGTEITRNAVLTDPASQLKQSIRHPAMVPWAAIVDPELTLTAPPAVTAASGLDALTQAIESYLSTKATPPTQALALQAIPLLYHHLRTACCEPADQAARTAVAQGSLLSAMAFSHSGLGAVHGLAHPLGAQLHLPHGLICATLLTPVLARNAPAVPTLIGHLSRALGLPSPEHLVPAIRQLADDLQIPCTLPGLAASHYPFILRHSRSNSMATNPVPLTDDDLARLLHQVTP